MWRMLNAAMARWLPVRRRESALVPRPSTIAFLREQDGPSEQLLKERLRPILAERSGVERAYLVRVRYDAELVERVALCCVGRPTRAAYARLQAVFAELFTRDNALDFISVTLDEEEEIVRVCRPFFLAR